MAIVPSSVLAAGWIPFVVVTLLVLVFSLLYVRYYQHREDKELCSTLASVVGLAMALFTCALLPVDIFLVSYMKHSNGTFKSWASDNSTRETVENGVLYTYYAMFSVVALFLFFILPFSYFFYEEGDEETTTKTRCCSAVKYSLIFVFMATIILVVGICVPFKDTDSFKDNSTEWVKIKNIFEDLDSNRMENALSFLISSLSLVGMVTLVIYTGIGMAAWPIHLIKGRRNIIREFREATEERAMTRSQIEAIENTYSGDAQVSRRDRRRLQDLQDRESLISRRERHLEAAEESCVRKCCLACRPFQIIFGVLFVLIALLIFVSLLLTNIDRVMHSEGMRMGYAESKAVLPNILDIIFVFAQKVFPLDYILIFAIVTFLIFCTMGGINAIGVWFCWIRMFKIRAHKTKPQGLLFLCSLLMLIVMALNVFLYQVMPQYFTYGSQHYVVSDVMLSGNSSSVTVKPCDITAPPDDCTMTRMGMLLYRFFFKMWFFGAAYFWLSWVFLAVFVMSFIVTVAKKRRSAIEGEVDDDDTDGSDDDDALIT